MTAIPLTFQDLILVISGLCSLITIIILFIRLTWWLAKQFSDMRKLMFTLHGENNRRLMRLELWANRKGFQPALDGEFTNGTGNAKSEDNH